jgi:hypothetical protein
MQLTADQLLFLRRAELLESVLWAITWDIYTTLQGICLRVQSRLQDRVAWLMMLNDVAERIHHPSNFRRN